MEKEALGFYITGHPLNRYQEIIEKFTNADALGLKDHADAEGVRIAGIVRSSKVIKTKKGDLMAFVAVEDMHGSTEVVVFSTVYAIASQLLNEDNPILVEGRMQKDEKSVKILADKIVSIDNAEETWTASIHLNLEMVRTDRGVLESLQKLLKLHTGPCAAFVHLKNPDNAEAVIALPESLKLKAGRSLKKEVEGLLGYKALETTCEKAGSVHCPNRGQTKMEDSPCLKIRTIFFRCCSPAVQEHDCGRFPGSFTLNNWSVSLRRIP